MHADYLSKQQQDPVEIKEKKDTKMRVAIYARNLSDQYGGVKEYTLSMIRALATTESIEVIHVVHNSTQKLFADYSRVNEILMQSNNRLYCDFVLAPRIIKSLRYDVIWFPNTSIIGSPKAPTVVTIHDLAYFIPELRAYKKLEGFYMKQRIKHSCRNATRIVTYSDSTRKDIQRFTGAPEERVSIICAAADTRFMPADGPLTDRLMVNGIEVPSNYLLYAGGITPRKNVGTLVRAFNRSNLDDATLIITGGSSAIWNSSDVLEFINDSPKIMRLGFVSDPDMVRLYQHAVIFVYPSLYEGFGLPIVEAQSCGCPVITYMNSSLPEVAGENSAYFVKDTSVESLAEAITTVYHSRDIANQLRKNGLLNASRYSWNKAAAEFTDLFESLIANRQ